MTDTKMQASPLTLKRLVAASLKYQWRLQLGVFLTVLLAALVLAGGLGVGTSVQESLRQQALTRLGNIHAAVQLHDRFFDHSLGARVKSGLPDSVKQELIISTLLTMKATAYPEQDTGAQQINGIQLIGVDEQFAQMSGNPDLFKEIFRASRTKALISPDLAKRWGKQQGELKIRFALPSVLPRDAPLSLSEDTQKAEDALVTGVLPLEHLGGYRLINSPDPVLNIYVSLDRLLEITELCDKESEAGKGNVLLVGRKANTEKSDAPIAGSIQQAIEKHWQLSDLELSIDELAVDNHDGKQVYQLNSGRIFIDGFLESGILASTEKNWLSQRVLTYFVNSIYLANKPEITTPYSMVTALEGVDDLEDGQTQFNQWLAEDLGAEKSGGQVAVKYFTLGMSRQLEEKTATFELSSVTPLSKETADRDLMPAFPGVADVEDINDWKPGIPIDLSRIKDEDEAYWDDYRGTPKAIISYEAGRKLWGNRFGDVTAIRFSTEKGGDISQLEEDIKTGINPSLVLQVRPVREIALEASKATTDFGGLFVGLSSFLIAAAITLAVLQFIFSIESRQKQLGTFKALGFTQVHIMKMILREGVIVSGVASLIGGVLGMGLTHVLVYGLNTVWADAVAGTSLHAHTPWHVGLTGFLLTWLITFFTMRWTLKRYLRKQAQSLLAGTEDTSLVSGSSGLKTLILKISIPVCIAMGVIISIVMAKLMADGTLAASMASGCSFGGGMLLLYAVLAWQYLKLKSVKGSTQPSSQLRYQSRQPGRSLTSSGVIASGIFLVISVAAFRIDPTFRAEQRNSGTGGFINWIEMDRPLLYDLSTQAARDHFGYEVDEIPEGRFVPMRIRPGDAASCLNLNKVSQPRLVGVNPDLLARKQAFRFSAMDKKTYVGDPESLDSPWRLLEWREDMTEVPAIVDMNTAMWALHKQMGGTLEYTDEKGTPFKIRIVGFLDTSILQGDLLIDEAALVARYPSISGHQILLMDRVSSAEDVPHDEVMETLSFLLEDYGLLITPTVDRLTAFTKVQNTYLDIFQMLGLLGLILGTCGLSLVVMRNVLERRGELALLQAVGYGPWQRLRQLIMEHAWILARGIVAGVLASIVAIWPLMDFQRLSDAAQLRQLTMPMILSIVLLCVFGLIAIYGASKLALKGGMLEALRSE